MGADDKHYTFFKKPKMSDTEGPNNTSHATQTTNANPVSIQSHVFHVLSTNTSLHLSS
jgi:hypothetical protein